jgi:hypothetical protein
MPHNKIVARYKDGRLKKGITMDFIPGKETFHIMPSMAMQGEKLRAISCKDLKAIFFVKDFAGNSRYQDKQELDQNQPVPGRKIKVLFLDGEQLVGTTRVYQPGCTGFFVTPADPMSNNERCYVIVQATREVNLI